jgi:hypothetical protein
LGRPRRRASRAEELEGLATRARPPAETSPLLPRLDSGIAGRLTTAAIGHAQNFAERLWQWLRSTSEDAAHHQLELNEGKGVGHPM